MKMFTHFFCFSLLLLSTNYNFCMIAPRIHPAPTARETSCVKAAWVQGEFKNPHADSSKDYLEVAARPVILALDSHPFGAPTQSFSILEILEEYDTDQLLKRPDDISYTQQDCIRI